MPSGISIVTEDIPDVGQMRMRYPIMPIHDYGNVIHKELMALADLTLKKQKFGRLYPDTRISNGTVEEVSLYECVHVLLMSSVVWFDLLRLFAAE